MVLREEKTLSGNADLSLLSRIFPYMRPQLFLFGLALFVVLALTALDLAIPWVTQQAVDRYIVPEKPYAEKGLPADTENPLVSAFLAENPGVILSEDESGKPIRVDRSALDKADAKTRLALRKPDLYGLFLMALLLLGMTVVHGAFGFVHTLLLELGGQRIVYSLRLAVFSHMRLLSLRYFQENPLGRMVTRVTGDVENLSEMFTSVITFVFKDIFLLFGIVGMLFYLDASLALATLLVLPLMVFLVFFFARVSRKVFRALRVRIAEINSKLSETIGGMTIIRLFGRENETFSGYEPLSRAHYDDGMRQVRIFAVFMPVMEFLGTLGLALVLYYGGGRILASKMSLGVLVAYLSYLRLFFRPIREIAEKYNTMQNAFSSAERLIQILDEPVAEEERTGNLDPGPVERIRFAGVSFAYQGQNWVLKDLDFEVKKGDTLAVVGPTGSGKTSLVSLLVRFWSPGAGKILINDLDLQNLSSGLWRNRLAMVMQDPFLFAGTLRENLQIQGKPLTDETLTTLLARAGCAALLTRLPKGLDTILKEDGKPLSSGERQLVSIARAFARSPEILILDEATSYVDSLSEREVQEAMARLMAGRTTFLVAHRLSTARHADRILVLRKGMIVESGTHEELIRNKGLYWRMQQLESMGKSGRKHDAAYGWK